MSKYFLINNKPCIKNGLDDNEDDASWLDQEGGV